MNTKLRPVQFGKNSENQIFVLKIGYGHNTKKGYGNYYINSYLAFKQNKKFKVLNDTDYSGKIQTYALDQDRFPLILAESQSQGEVASCKLFGFIKDKYEEIELPSKFPDCEDIKVSSDGIIGIGFTEIKLFKYNRGILTEVFKK